jgi:hypothetical protein
MFNELYSISLKPQLFLPAFLKKTSVYGGLGIIIFRLNFF